MTASARTPWACLTCDEHGDTQATAERHTRDLGRATTTAATPDSAAAIAARAKDGRRGQW